jgi:membrane fusion protein (multidrug efflux system)
VDGKALRQKVEIGQRREGKVEVVSGLKAEDVVVTAGHQKIRDGAAVTIARQPAAPAAQPVLNNAAPAAKTKG